MCEQSPQPSYVVGSYSMVPKKAPELERDYLAGLAASPLCSGLEVALTSDGHINGSHANDEAWFIQTLQDLGVLRRWKYIITLIPPTMDGISKNPHFGLASDNEDGRVAAVELAKKACAAVNQLSGIIGPCSNVFVELHAGPTRHGDKAKAAGVSSSVSSLVKSLQELCTLDWNAAQLVIEHCDWYGGVAPVKGFLSLAEEIEALKTLNKGMEADAQDRKVLLAVNWARSVLETREAQTAASHVKMARDEGLLCGLMFSGCSGVEGPYGQWKDSHMPHAHAEGIEHFAEGSLLTETEMRGCLLAAGGVDNLGYLGAKLTAKHVDDRDVQARISLYRDMLTLIQSAAGQTSDEAPSKKPRCDD